MLLGTRDLWLFVLSGLLLNITPGPDTLYIIGRSSTQGWRAGAFAALGIGAGTLVHICAAALGLSAILAFLPQFVASDASSKPLAFLFLGAVFDFNGTIWNLLIAWSTAHLSSRLALRGAFKQWFNRCVGAVFIFIGVRLALTYER
jgi:threonine/homoserine/homoserine lactone efflux protein